MNDEAPRGATGSTGAIGDVSLAGVEGYASSSDYSVGVTGPTGAAGEIETTQVPKTEIERALHGLMSAFENSATTNYGVTKARTSVTVTKTAGGKLELGFGLGPFKIGGAEGALKGEVSQVFEIEIGRIEGVPKSNAKTEKTGVP